jgi:hypothetical protein
LIATITPEENQKLFAFCEECNVKYYDVQIELVDHLASSIEEQWMQHPNRSFDNAMGIALRDFTLGLKHISKEKERALNKKYQQIHWYYIRASFSWPKALRTLALVLILFSAFRLTPNNLLVIIPTIAMVLSVIFYYYFYYYPNNIRIKTDTSKKFLLLKRLRLQNISVLAIAFFPLHIFNITKFQIPNNIYIEFLVAFLTVLFGIAAYSQLFYIPKKINQYFLKQFSEFAQ